jgi:glutamate/tyrosine decarboxylase-like PLP-dependent enzyme
MDNVESLPVDDHGSITAETLEAALTASDRPTILLLQAGDLCTGAYDRFDELVPVAHKHGAWVHVDGAFGLWAAASPNYRHLTKGIELADSWVTDGHKWLNVPYDAGYCFVAHPEAHSGAVSYAVSYIVGSDESRDTKDWNMEMSRRGRGFATWAALRSLGRQGVADLVDHCCRKAEQLTLGIGDLPGAEVLWAPIINQGLVRFLDPKPGATDADHDHQTDAVIANILASGEALFGGVTWNGKRAMRISVSNWHTSDEDIARTLCAIQKAIAKANNG